MASPSRVAAVWFPPEHRTIATGIVYLGGTVGSAVGYLLGSSSLRLNGITLSPTYVGPWLVPSPDDVPQLLYVTAGWAGLFMLVVLLYAPDHPAQPPSRAMREAQHERQDVTTRMYVKQMLGLMTQPSLVLLVLAGGIEAGVDSAWGGLLTQILTEYSSNFVGWLGFFNAIAAGFGTVAAGLIGDKYFQQRLKLLLIIFFVITIACFTWFTLILPCPWAAKGDIGSNKASIIIAITLTGFFQGRAAHFVDMFH